MGANTGIGLPGDGGGGTDLSGLSDNQRTPIQSLQPTDCSFSGFQIHPMTAALYRARRTSKHWLTFRAAFLHSG